MTTLMIGCIAAGVLFLILLFWLMSLRRVVAPNEVHIVRRGKKTLVYGSTDKKNLTEKPDDTKSSGNSYYQFPSSIPVLGVMVLKLPLSVFPIDLKEYEAYDKDRVPFVVDIKAFFRVSDYKKAAERVSNIEELKSQLTGIVQGSVRAILAKQILDTIMEERSAYGEQFTKEVVGQLEEWGVTPVKNIELMDVRDGKGEKVIDDIMAKKKSRINMESRTERAENERKAREAEIDAEREIALKEQAKEEIVGKREAEVEQEIGIAKEKSSQAVQEEAKTTKEKEMAVLEVDTIRRAEINKKKLIVDANASQQKADVDKQTTIVNAEASKQKIKLEAEADKEKRTLEAEADLEVKTKAAEAVRITGENNAMAIQAEGAASAEAKKAMELALVQGQIELADKIGENEGYQQYLVRVREVEAKEAIGKEQARNLGNASIKIVAQAGDVAGGLNSALDIFTSKGGKALNGLFETLGGTDGGKALLDKLGISSPETPAKTTTEFEDVK